MPSKAPVQAMDKARRMEVVAQFRDDVLSKLADAFFQVVKEEGWGKRDLSRISGIDETAISHVLAGRRKNLTLDTIALLTRAMRKRPEFMLHDLRPAGNNPAALAGVQAPSASAAAAVTSQVSQAQRPISAANVDFAGGGDYQRSASVRGLEVVP